MTTPVDKKRVNSCVLKTRLSLREFSNKKICGKTPTMLFPTCLLMSSLKNKARLAPQKNKPRFMRLFKTSLRAVSIDDFLIY